MEILSMLLLIFGMMSLIFELLLPGFGIFGLFGMIFIILSWGMTIFLFKFGVLIVLTEIILLSLLVLIIVKQLKNMKLYRKIVLSDVVGKEQKEIINIEHFIGMEGLTKTDLRPFGTAQFNDIIIEVLSDDGYIKSNSKIKVMRIEENKIYVKPLNCNENIIL